MFFCNNSCLFYVYFVLQKTIRQYLRLVSAFVILGTKKSLWIESTFWFLPFPSFCGRDFWNRQYLLELSGTWKAWVALYLWLERLQRFWKGEFLDRIEGSSQSCAADRRTWLCSVAPTRVMSVLLKWVENDLFVIFPNITQGFDFNDAVRLCMNRNHGSWIDHEGELVIQISRDS